MGDLELLAGEDQLPLSSEMMQRLALLLMAFAAFWIGAPACAHGTHHHDDRAKTYHHAHHDQPHGGLAQACAGCALPAVVPETPPVPSATTLPLVALGADVPALRSRGPGAPAPPPRASA